jgi:hypothetical protein
MIYIIIYDLYYYVKSKEQRCVRASCLATVGEVRFVLRRIDIVVVMISMTTMIM